MGSSRVQPEPAGDQNYLPSLYCSLLLVMYSYGGEKIVYWQIIKRGLGAFFRCPRKRFVTSRWKSVKIYGKINTQCWGLMFAQLTLLSYKGKSCPKQEWRKRERACECVRVCAIKDRESAATCVSEERGEKDHFRTPFWFLLSSESQWLAVNVICLRLQFRHGCEP